VAKPRVHRDETIAGGLRKSLCGMVGVATTQDDATVTCVLCLRELATLARLGVASHEVAPVETRGAVWDSSLETIATATVPGRVDREHRWQSAERALEEWARLRVDGYSVRLTSAATEALGRDGVRVDGGGAAESQAERQADSVAEVERVVRHVFGAIEWGGLLDADTALRAMLWRYVAATWVRDPKRRASRMEPTTLTPESIAERLDREHEGVTARVVARTTERAMRLVRVELTARGLVRPRRCKGEWGRAAWEREQAMVAMRERELRKGGAG